MESTGSFHVDVVGIPYQIVCHIDAILRPLNISAGKHAELNCLSVSGVDCSVARGFPIVGGISAIGVAPATKQQLQVVRFQTTHPHVEGFGFLDRQPLARDMDVDATTFVVLPHHFLVKFTNLLLQPVLGEGLTNKLLPFHAPRWLDASICSCIEESVMLAGVTEFEGPVAGVRIASDEAGNFIFDPTFDQIASAHLDLTVAGTLDAITMVESQ